MEPPGKEEKRQAKKHLASRSPSGHQETGKPPGVKSKEKHRTGVTGGPSSTAYTLGGVIGVSKVSTYLKNRFRYIEMSDSHIHIVFGTF